MQRETPFLWFDHEAEEAMNFYVSVFKNSKITSVNRVDGRVMTAHFEFTEAISFFIDCETQQEVDMFWERLSEGGEKSQCGWLKDKYGLSWQVVPTALNRMLADKDPEKAQRVMQAMLQMSKIDVAELERARDDKAE